MKDLGVSVDCFLLLLSAHFHQRSVILQSLVIPFHFYWLCVVERNREIFKNFVNALAAVKSEGVSYHTHTSRRGRVRGTVEDVALLGFLLLLFPQGEKFIILKPKFYPAEWGGALPGSLVKWVTVKAPPCHVALSPPLNSALIPSLIACIVIGFSVLCRFVVARQQPI